MHRTALAIGSLMLAGCASTTVKAIPDDTVDKGPCTVGFRYYESSPYILVYSDGKSGLTSNLLYLPDTTKKRSVELSEVLATNTATLQFSDGVLTSAKNKGDAAAIPKAIVDAAKGAAASAVKAAAAANEVAATTGAKNEFSAPGPMLFKLVVKGADTKLIPSTGGAAISVHVPEG